MLFFSFLYSFHSSFLFGLIVFSFVSLSLFPLFLSTNAQMVRFRSRHPGAHWPVRRTSGCYNLHTRRRLGKVRKDPTPTLTYTARKIKFQNSQDRRDDGRGLLGFACLLAGQNVLSRGGCVAPGLGPRKELHERGVVSCHRLVSTGFGSRGVESTEAQLYEE